MRYRVSNKKVPSTKLYIKRKWHSRHVHKEVKIAVYLLKLQSDIKKHDCCNVNKWMIIFERDVKKLSNVIAQIFCEIFNGLTYLVFGFFKIMARQFLTLVFAFIKPKKNPHDTQ